MRSKVICFNLYNYDIDKKELEVYFKQCSEELNFFSGNDKPFSIGGLGLKTAKIYINDESKICINDSIENICFEENADAIDISGFICQNYNDYYICESVEKRNAYLSKE